MTWKRRVVAIVGALGASVVVSRTAAAQSASDIARALECPIALDWIKDKGEYTKPKVTSVALQRIESQWSIDTASATKELAAILFEHATLLGKLTAGGKACPARGCVCRRPADLPQTSKLARIENLAASYHADDEGASAGIAVFLSSHQKVLTRLADSLQRFGSRDQRGDFQKGLGDTQKDLQKAMKKVGDRVAGGVTSTGRGTPP